MFTDNQSLIKNEDVYSMIMYENIVHEKYEAIVNVIVYNIKKDTEWFDIHKNLKQIMDKSIIGFLVIHYNKSHLSTYQILFDKEKYIENSFSFYFNIYKDDAFCKKHINQYKHVIDTKQLLKTSSRYTLSIKDTNPIYGKMKLLLEYQ